MKKSIFAIFLALAVTLTACNNGGTEEQTDSQSTPQESSQSETSPTEESSDSSSQSENPTDTSSQTEQSAEPAPPPEDCDFLFPDGSAGYYADGNSDDTEGFLIKDGFLVQYDFAFMRYALPYYYDTDTAPELYDFEIYEFNEDMINPELDYKYFKVQKGDKVGPFTVKDAWYKLIHYNDETENDPSLFECVVELEGSVTVDGILYCAFEDEYALAQGDMDFYPDPTSCENLPLPFNSHVTYVCDIQGEKAYAMDSDFYHVGNVNDVGIQDYFSDGTQK